jgi:hypothetical protein
LKKVAVIALLIVALMAFAGVASAEHGNIGGVGTTMIRTMESGNIGGVSVR